MKKIEQKTRAYLYDKYAVLPVIIIICLVLGAVALINLVILGNNPSVLRFVVACTLVFLVSFYIYGSIPRMSRNSKIQKKYRKERSKEIALNRAILKNKIDQLNKEATEIDDY